MKPRVMIVEDHLSYRRRLVSAAQAQGFKVVAECDQAEDAIEIFNVERPAVVVIDLHLKGQVDGLQLSRLLVDIDRHTRVVAASSFTDPELMEQAFEMGAHRCLRKPFGMDEAMRLFENLAEEMKTVLS